MIGQSSPPSRILLVEDHADTADTFARLLEMQGFRVNVADTFASAFDLASRLPFDLLLADIELPDGDGCQLLSKLRGELGMDNLRAVAISGYGEQKMIERVKAAGFDAYMLKPVQIKQLYSVLEQVRCCDQPKQSPGREFVAVLPDTLHFPQQPTGTVTETAAADS